MELYKKGSKGEMVKQIQKMLASCGYSAGIVDGVFGNLTEEAVKAFQKEKGLVADGIVGVKTLALLIPQSFKRSKRNIKEIIVHCSDTPEGRHTTVEDIRAWHKANGWSDIGYHYVVYLDGSIHNGRDVDITGAHCSGHNSHSIGVCYIGGKTKDMKSIKDTRTIEQKESLLYILRELKKLYPNATIYGHHNFDKSKPCPCFDAYNEYTQL